MVEISITAAQSEALLKDRQVTRYAPSQVLFYRDHVPMGLWVLHKGEVVLREDGRITAYVVGPCLLGLKELMARTPYPLTAQAMTTCEMGFIGKEELGMYLGQTPLAQVVGNR